MSVDLSFGMNSYMFTLAPTADGTFLILEEKTKFAKGKELLIQAGDYESVFGNERTPPKSSSRGYQATSMSKQRRRV